MSSPADYGGLLVVCAIFPNGALGVEVIVVAHNRALER